MANKLTIRREDGSLWRPAAGPGSITRRQEKKHRSEKQKAGKSNFTHIVNRQNGMCWFCNTYMGVDCTREHLLARVRGGRNEAGNLRAAHGDCNSAAGHLPVKAKYKLRKIGHEQGRQALIEAAHRMRRQQTRETFVKRPKVGHRLTFVAVDGSGEMVTTFYKPRKRPLVGPTGLVLDPAAPSK